MRSPRFYPQVSFINGFCYLITRESLNHLGYLDEEKFPRGYGEEDDFSVRAQDAGWMLRVADDCYVYHAKSKSFTSQIRTEITANTKIALQTKHGKTKIDTLLQQIQHNESLLIARTLAKIATHPAYDNFSAISLDIPDSHHSAHAAYRLGAAPSKGGGWYPASHRNDQPTDGVGL